MKRPLRKIKNDLIYYGSRTLIFLIGFLSYERAGRCGRVFGIAIFNLVHGERRKTLDSIRTAYPDSLTDEEVEQLGMRVWEGLGRNLFEVVRWMTMSRQTVVSQIARVEGWEHLEKAISRGKGVLLVTGHLGNWELLGAYLASRHPTAAVAKSVYDPRFDALITSLRSEKLKATMIKRGMALRGIIQALQENQVIMMLCDQDTGQDGVFVPFFEKLAWTQSGVARIAQRRGAAIVPAFVVRGEDHQFELQVEKEIEIPVTHDPEADVLETVNRYTRVIESYVKTYPHQWMWMHRRWKTRPEMELASELSEKEFAGSHSTSSRNLYN
jgi:KDO2-lipid IV(A) lauroyltransferase